MADFACPPLLPWLPALLQTSDALFPTGAYAHSLGFEESVRLGGVRNEATLTAFLREQILPAQRALELPYLRFAHDVLPDLAALAEIDCEISAWKLPAESRAASMQLGGRRLKALRAISSDPLLGEYEGAIASGVARGHHLVIAALQAHSAQIPLEAALQVSAYQALAATCAAALKLIRIGQDGIQRALHTAACGIPDTVAASLSVQRADAGWFNPLLEIASLRHQHAGERLFIS